MAAIGRAPHIGAAPGSAVVAGGFQPISRDGPHGAVWCSVRQRLGVLAAVVVVLLAMDDEQGDVHVGDGIGGERFAPRLSEEQRAAERAPWARAVRRARGLAVDP